HVPLARLLDAGGEPVMVDGVVVDADEWKTLIAGRVPPLNLRHISSPAQIADLVEAESKADRRRREALARVHGVPSEDIWRVYAASMGEAERKATRRLRQVLHRPDLMADELSFAA